jgi:hypothetical protein
MLELPRQANNGESFFAFGGCLNTVDIVGALLSLIVWNTIDPTSK